MCHNQNMKWFVNWQNQYYVTSKSKQCGCCGLVAQCVESFNFRANILHLGVAGNGKLARWGLGMEN